jgi:hypothetical protein
MSLAAGALLLRLRSAGDTSAMSPVGTCRHRQGSGRRRPDGPKQERTRVAAGPTQAHVRARSSSSGSGRPVASAAGAGVGQGGRWGECLWSPCSWAADVGYGRPAMITEILFHPYLFFFQSWLIQQQFTPSHLINKVIFIRFESNIIRNINHK